MEVKKISLLFDNIKNKQKQMARKYKVVKVTESELEFMKKYKVSACTYCSYSVSFIYCNFNGECPANDNEYLKKN